MRSTCHSWRYFDIFVVNKLPSQEKNFKVPLSTVKKSLITYFSLTGESNMIGLAEEEYKKGTEEMLKTTEIFTFVL